jgi:hypothetical protein
MANRLPKRLFLGRTAILWIGLALVASMAFAQRAVADTSACNFQNGLGSFSATNQPGDCWRPYSDSSPFNQPVPANPPLAPDSAAVGQTLGALSTPLNIGESRYVDGGHPTFWSQPGDPMVTLHALWSSSPISGMQIRVPAQATPAGGFSFGDGWPNQHDSHMTIVDQASGWEYDLWNVQSMSAGVLTYTNGCRTKIDGSGLGSCAVAANFGNLAGIVRLEELKAGHIDHALFISVPYVNGHVYPAPADNDNHGPGVGVPELGAHVWLDMTPAEIDALPIPAYRKTIAKAFAKYGAYVGDSGNGFLGIEHESPQTYSSFGRHDWTNWAASVGGSSYQTPDGMPAWHLSLDGVPVGSRLRVLDPCTASGTCPASPDASTGSGSAGGGSASMTPSAAAPAPAADPEAAPSVESTASGNDDCWKQRAVWARAYRRAHKALGPGYRRALARMARACAQDPPA